MADRESDTFASPGDSEPGSDHSDVTTTPKEWILVRLYSEQYQMDKLRIRYADDLTEHEKLELEVRYQAIQ